MFLNKKAITNPLSDTSVYMLSDVHTCLDESLHLPEAKIAQPNI